MTPITKHIFITVIFIGLFSCGQKKKNIPVMQAKVNNSYQPVYTVKQLNDKLESSFKQIQPDSLERIFADWNKTIVPNSEDFIHQNDTINRVYTVYKEFYKPFDLLKLGDWEWGNNLNATCKYVIVQNKLFYSILSSDNFGDYDWQKSRKDSITNFRPPIDMDKHKVLYLTEEYAKAINKFLGTESTGVGEGNIMNPSRPVEESEKRYKMLRPYIPVLHGHWGGYWHLETHPDISIIVFNKEMTKAKIYFRVGYQGGEALLERNDDSWTMKESKATWIE